MKIDRNIEAHLRRAAGRAPVLTLTGPRQSGKTTLVRSMFKSHDYVTLEAPDVRALAQGDPRGFLDQFGDGVVIDEVQHVPDLLSYIQVLVDDDPAPGRWVLTGSNNFALLESVTQSLAGRTSIHKLLPLSWDEVQRFEQRPANLSEALFAGGYPRIFNEGLNPSEWLQSYIYTYLERDVRSLANIGDLAAFQRFVELCAGRSGTLLNYSSLASDCGVAQPTAKRWMGILEASFIAFTVPSFSKNLRKRVTKMPKLYFCDTGLMCWMLGIRESGQIDAHPLRGQIFETWVASEIVKHRASSGMPDRIYHYRDHNGSEVDIVIPESDTIELIEAKSAATPSPSLIARTKRVKRHVGDLSQSVFAVAVYGGDQRRRYGDDWLIPWRELRYPLKVTDTKELSCAENAVLVSANGQPLPGVDVLALFPNRTWVASATNAQGVARLKLYANDRAMKVYIATAGFAAHFDGGWLPHKGHLGVELSETPNGGSVIFQNGVGNIPGISGRLNPIRDTSDRTYLYADNIAINGGVQQPVTFELGEDLHLMDAEGHECRIRIIDLTGRSALIGYVAN